MWHTLNVDNQGPRQDFWIAGADSNIVPNLWVLKGADINRLSQILQGAISPTLKIKGANEAPELIVSKQLACVYLMY